MRVLLLMGHRTYKARSFGEAAERLGVDASVGTDLKQVLADLNPRGNLTLDFSRPERAVETIRDHAKRWGCDAVVATDDEGVLLAARAADALGLPHTPLPALRAARNKALTRERLRAAGLPTPWFRELPLETPPVEVAGGLPYPVVVKPLALSASRGVIRADDPAGFEAACQRLGQLLERREEHAELGEWSRSFLVEQYIPGQEVAVEALLSGGKPRILAIFDKPDPLEGPFFEETIYTTPSRHPRELQRAIAESLERSVAALGLETGPLHAELRLNDSGVWPLELAPRSIGGHCSRALHFEGGHSLEEVILGHALGLPVGDARRQREASGVMMIPVPRAGVLEAVERRERAAAVDHVDEVEITIPPGERVEPAPEGSRYLGFIFASADEPASVEAALREAHAQLEIRIVKG